jgi:hypothetical protein
MLTADRDSSTTSTKEEVFVQFNNYSMRGHERRVRILKKMMISFEEEHTN